MTPPSPPPLLRHPAVWRVADAPLGRMQREPALATGFGALDQALPDGGWPAHGLAELLCPRWGCGEAALLLPLLQQLGAQERWLVWVNPPWMPFAPALAAAGVALDRCLVLRSKQERDLLWTLEQCLASGSCALVQGWPVRPTAQQLRRLQLAAQKGHCLGLLLRPTACARQPSPAPLRLELGWQGPQQGLGQPEAGTAAQGLCVRVVKCRGGWGSDWLALQEIRPPQDLRAQSVEFATGAAVASAPKLTLQPVLKPVFKPGLESVLQPELPSVLRSLTDRPVALSSLASAFPHTTHAPPAGPGH